MPCDAAAVQQESEAVVAQVAEAVSDAFDLLMWNGLSTRRLGLAFGGDVVRRVVGMAAVRAGGVKTQRPQAHAEDDRS